MKVPLIAKMPWDLVVFLTITTVGFGLSVKKLANSGSLRSVASVEMAPTETHTAAPSSRSGVITMEMGCLERSAGIRNDITQGAIRLKGKFCDLTKNESKEALGTVKIKNLTTGQDSMVFLSGNDAFITEGMPLKTGKNIFTLEWKTKNKDRELRAEIYGR